jgi:pyruvate,water dikinase
MVGAIDVSMFRPNDELKRLARRALELGIADLFLANGSGAVVLRALRENEGRTGLAQGMGDQCGSPGST